MPSSDGLFNSADSADCESSTGNGVDEHATILVPVPASVMETSLTGGASVFPSTTYLKPYLTYEQMLEQLSGRGMMIPNSGLAVDGLRNIGYYRLSGYWYSWRELDNSITNKEVRLDTFRADSSFDDLIRLYEFDAALRPLLLEGIAIIEIGLRARLAHFTGRSDHWFYLHRSSYISAADRIPEGGNSTNFERFIERCDSLLSRSSESFVGHFRRKHDGMPPIWIAVETWDLGMLTTCIDMLSDDLKQELAEQFGMKLHRPFGGHLRSINQIRNICAHQGRLYSRVIKPETPTKYMKDDPWLGHIPAIQETQRKNKLYPSLVWITYVLRHIHPSHPWMTNLKSLLASFPDQPNARLSDYGFPNDWQGQDIWLQMDGDEVRA